MEKAVVVPSVNKIEAPTYLKLSRVLGYAVRIWSIIGIFFLTMRVFLLLAAANMETPFVRFVYSVSGDYLRPFKDIFAIRNVGGESYFDVAATFAIIAYLFIMWGVTELITYVEYRVEVYKKQKELEIKELERLQAKVQMNSKAE